METVEEALHYLVETDEEFARRKGRMKAAEYLLKARKGSLFLEAEGKTDAAKKAYVDMAAVEHGYVQEFEDAWREHEEMNAKRMTATIRIDVYRSKLSAKKQGIDI